MFGTALAIGGIAYGAYSDRKGAKEAEEIAEREAFLEWETTKEELRRMDREQSARRGQAVSQTAAAGVLLTGSAESYLRDFDAETMREREFVEKVGASKAANIKARGKSASRAGKASTISAGLDILNVIGESQDWWS